MPDFQLRYATLCSGVEAVSVAWEPLGMRPMFFSEIEPFPSAVLAERWPTVPNLGDLTKINGADWQGKIDILWASFPCQDFSIRGDRTGADGARGSLTLQGIDLVDAIDPYFFCFENVKGILNDSGNAFGKFLGRLVGENRALEPPRGKWTNAGHVHGPRRSAAWRVMDAQYGGVAQQRERVFLIACPRNGASPQSILFESEGKRRDFAPSVEMGTPITKTLPRGSRPYKWQVPVFKEIARCLTTKTRYDAFSENFIAELATPNPRDPEAKTLRQLLRACPQNLRSAVAAIDARVRILTPLEFERLQGLPDFHTQIVWKGRAADECPDGPRYKAVGNSLAVPDVRWIGQRINQAVEDALKRRSA